MKTPLPLIKHCSRLAHIFRRLLAMGLGAMLVSSVVAQNVTLTPVSGLKLFAGGGSYGGIYTNIQIKAALSGDFTTIPNPVTLSVSGAPAGVTCSFTTTSFTNSQNGDFLWVAVTNVAKGTYPLTVSATTNGVQVGNSIVIPLIVGTLWTSSTADINWSTVGNWSGGVPTVNDDVMFQDASSNTNYVDSSTTISSLTYIRNVSGTSQDMTLAPGTTLSVLGTNGFALNEDSYPGNSKTMKVNIIGTNATLLVSNAAANVAINGISSGSSSTTLTMSSLDTFKAYVDRLGVADVNFAVQGAVGIQIARVDFAKTNLINASHIGNFATDTYLDYAVSIAYNSDSYNNGSSQTINLGIQNIFQADSIGFAQGRMGGSSSAMQFNSLFTSLSPSVSFRNTDGSRVSLVAVAVDAGTNQTGSNTKFKLNLVNGYVDMLVDQMWIARNRFTNNANANPVGSLAFDNGVVDVNTLRLGYQAYTNNSHCNGTVTVGGNATNSALLKVNTDLNLGYTSGDYASGVEAAKGYGQVVINTNGIVRANQVTVGTLSGNNLITVNNGGLLDVTNTVASNTTRLGTLTVNNGGAITLHINGASTLVYVTNLVASSGIINIGSVTASSFASVISYAPGFGETASFVAGSVPPGYNATVFNNTTTHTIDVTLTTGTPKTLLWQGYVNNNWDTTTKNWLDLSTSVHTNFSTGDSAVFDDSASFFSVNVAEDVVPRQSAGVNGMVMTNNTHAYVFSGSGGIRGAASFAKYGTGSVEIDNYSEIAVSVNQGSLTGGGTIGSAVLASGTVGSLLAGGNVIGSVSTAGSLTNAATIGSSLSILTGGLVTNTVAGTVSGTLSMETGTSLGNAGTFSSIGSPTIPTNAVVFNDGTIKGNALSVSGTLEDTGIGTINMNTALTINGGGTFIPGGDFIGTTTIYENPLGAPGITGRLLLGTGSTNVFKVNMDSGIQNTVVKSVYTSFGPNQSSVAYNGGTIVIMNTGSASFAAGQSFPLFQNTYGGSLGNAGLNTTNSYPVISPANPGPGLQWDLSTVIQNGTIGIKTINMTPTNLVYSAALINSGSNIVTHLQWPSDYTGWYLQSQQNPLTIGLSTNWTTIGGSSFTNDMVFTNAVITNTAVFYRMVFPQP